MSSERFRIFIGEGHAILREGLRLALSLDSQLDIVGQTADGSGLLSAIQELRPHIVILDIHLPGFPGTDGVREIISRGIKIIIFSEFETAARVLDIVHTGAHAVILKQDSLDDVRKAIAAVIQGHSYFSASLQTLSFQESPRKLLTDRELEIVKRIASGQTTKKMAQDLKCSENTIKTHKTSVMAKAGVKNSAELTAWAAKMALLDP